MKKIYYTLFSTILCILPIQTSNSLSNKIICAAAATSASISTLGSIYLYNKIKKYNSILENNTNITDHQAIISKLNLYKKILFGTIGFGVISTAIASWKGYRIYKNKEVTLIQRPENQIDLMFEKQVFTTLSEDDFENTKKQITNLYNRRRKNKSWEDAASFIKRDILTKIVQTPHIKISGLATTPIGKFVFENLDNAIEKIGEGRSEDLTHEELTILTLDLSDQLTVFLNY